VNYPKAFFARSALRDRGEVVQFVSTLWLIL
jgi:hypothetical protein